MINIHLFDNLFDNFPKIMVQRKIDRFTKKNNFPKTALETSILVQFLIISIYFARVHFTASEIEQTKFL